MAPATLVYKVLSLSAPLLIALASLSTSVSAHAEAFVGEMQAIEKCKGGDIPSCDFLAQSYLSVQDYKNAATYLNKVCYSNADNATKTCSALTALLTDPTYGINDFKKGFEISDYLCSSGVAFNCTTLASAYFRGDHVQQDLKKAKYYSREACSMKDITGCREAAVILFSEAYVLKDIHKANEAFNFYDAACKLGDQDSCTEYKQAREKLQQFRLYVENSKKK